MSTKQFQAYEDANAVYREAEERLKAMRAEFIKHVRETGTAMRKQLIVDGNGIACIATRIKERPPTDAFIAMQVEIQSVKDGSISVEFRNALYDYLHANGWVVKTRAEADLATRARLILHCI